MYDGFGSLEADRKIFFYICTFLKTYRNKYAKRNIGYKKLLFLMSINSVCKSSTRSGGIHKRASCWVRHEAQLKGSREMAAVQGGLGRFKTFDVLAGYSIHKRLFSNSAFRFFFVFIK